MIEIDNTYTDSSIFFARIDVPGYPLTSSVEFPPAPPFQSNVMLGNKGMITDEMNSIFHSLGLEVDLLILWTWNHFDPKRSLYQIHSDGHINNHPRAFAMNWVLEGDSCVEWYSVTGAIPKLTTKSHRTADRFTVTEWHYDEIPQPLARWNSTGPAILNIRQPHSVVINGITTRKTITMRFKPNIEIDDMVSRLGNRVISINQ